MNRTLKYLIVCLLLIGSCKSLEKEEETHIQELDWPAYGGNTAGNRYSPLTQINKDNVQQLQVAWTYDTGENNNPEERGINIQCQPIMANGMVYATSPKLKLFAVRATTGEEVWKFDPFKDKTAKYHPNRGVLYWEDGDDRRILFTAGPTLYALNATTGELVPSFGVHGEVDLHEGLGDVETLGHDVKQLTVDVTTPGVIYKDILIIGSRVSEYGDAAPGYIRAFDVRTGKLKWVFHTIPQPGEYGYETWPKDAYKRVGGANAWGGLVADLERGVVYTGTGSASFDFYGGNRHGENLFANCILALDAETGKRLWHFQTQHHDIWDRDLPCPPNLVTVTHNGKKIDALVAATKDGLVFVLNRDTGEPLFPVEEVPVTTEGALPGEQPWPTQPIPTKPAPLSRQEITLDDLTDISPEAHAYVKERFLASRYGSKYIPPSEQGTFYVGIGGGAEWGGNATTPDGILIQNANETPYDLKMSSTALADGSDSPGKALFATTCAPCHGADKKGSEAFPSLVDVGKRLTRDQITAVVKTGRGRMPSFQHMPDHDRETIVNFLMETEPRAPVAALTDFHSAVPTAKAKPDTDFPYTPPYINNGYKKFLDSNGYPAVKPPWGTLNAIDLNTGEYLWRVPLGEYPELTAKGIPQTGTESYGGPVVTASGLIFIAGTYDEKIRAFDRHTGKVMWEYKLPAGGFATPITYMASGKQYVVIAAGGSRNGLKPGGSYVAFALP
ncbi:quinoprotein glucose dehydrogenase [Pontibacter ummariensis]|uniref:Quinoprotein glucose dehydrogenase n=1 Tax=Pontibacter ummariensis TaxID=1610492 RepID=A0A239B903_9BACT|nr:PQQ-binding-like beta-propeller repeat protein [Pontibacter ummariensis]PRY16381.1 quinoprotein glucose dehydrogenase [Pontibacter ummariensis]SNS04169.1 quinoprotein glucose dehydrogenase [Pontibacter ummariensis]